MIHAALTALLGLAAALPAGVTAATDSGTPAAVLSDDDVALSARANLSVDDDGLSVWLDLRLGAIRPGVRVWTADHPLLLPLLVPAVRGAVLDRGILSAATKHVTVQTEAAVHTERGPSGLALTGTLRAGREITLRVKYVVAVDRERIDLGFRGAVARTSLAVATMSTKKVRVRLIADRPARLMDYVQGRDRITGLSLVHPLRRGEAATVRLLDFPVRSLAPGRLLRSAALLLSIFALAAALGARGRS